MEQLHRKRLEILKFIARGATREAGLAPSVREIAKAVGSRSSQTVHHHLSKLEAEGYLERLNDRSRTLRLTAKGWVVGHDRTGKGNPWRPRARGQSVGRATRGG